MKLCLAAQNQPPSLVMWNKLYVLPEEYIFVYHVSLNCYGPAGNNGQVYIQNTI